MEKLAKLTKIDPWFLHKMNNIVKVIKRLKTIDYKVRLKIRLKTIDYKV